MFVKVLSYTREGGSYSKEKYVWVNTDTLWGFNKKGDMYVIPFPIPISLSNDLANFSLVQIPTPIPNKKTTPKGGFLVWLTFRNYFVHYAHQPDG